MTPITPITPSSSPAAVLSEAARQRLDALLDQALAPSADAAPRRWLLGLVGAPGAGKSTLAAALLTHCEQRLPGCAQIVPMDGFHLAQVELTRLGRTARKGAPDTFDAAGYIALLQRLRQPAPPDQPPEALIYAPAFRRDLEEPIAGAIPVGPNVRLVITEGNYLLLPESPWSAARALLDQTWYIDPDPDVRRQRLMARHEHHGRSPEAARAWVEHTDEPNARRIDACKPSADWIWSV